MLEKLYKDEILGRYKPKALKYGWAVNQRVVNSYKLRGGVGVGVLGKMLTIAADKGAVPTYKKESRLGQFRGLTRGTNFFAPELYIDGLNLNEGFGSLELQRLEIVRRTSGKISLPESRVKKLVKKATISVISLKSKKNLKIFYNTWGMRNQKQLRGSNMFDVRYWNFGLAGILSEKENNLKSNRLFRGSGLQNNYIGAGISKFKLPTNEKYPSKYKIKHIVRKSLLKNILLPGRLYKNNETPIIHRFWVNERTMSGFEEKGKKFKWGLRVANNT